MGKNLILRIRGQDRGNKDIYIEEAGNLKLKEKADVFLGRKEWKPSEINRNAGIKPVKVSVELFKPNRQGKSNFRNYRWRF